MIEVEESSANCSSTDDASDIVADSEETVDHNNHNKQRNRYPFVWKGITQL